MIHAKFDNIKLSKPLDSTQENSSSFYVGRVTLAVQTSNIGHGGKECNVHSV